VTRPIQPAHVGDELIDLVAGESSPATARKVVAHLRSCPRCADQLISAVFAVCALRTTAQVDRELAVPIRGSSTEKRPTDGGAQPELALVGTTRTPSRWRKRLAAVAASMVLLVSGLLVGIRVASSRAPVSGPTIVDVTLRPLEAPQSARGHLTVEAAGDSRQLLVETTALPTPPSNHFYEVWLLDPKTFKMLSMGVLGPSGQGKYAVAASIMSGYSAVDVSLQANDGDPAHSRISVLRATY
jgi:Anti-sigma-K factor rskA, C-terminal/Putative zinc-finger